MSRGDPLLVAACRGCSLLPLCRRLLLHSWRRPLPRSSCPHWPTAALPPLFSPPLQLFTWSGASASVAFEGAGSITVSFDGRMSSLPKEHEQTRAVKKDSTFPWVFFQVRIAAYHSLLLGQSTWWQSVLCCDMMLHANPLGCTVA